MTISNALYSSRTDEWPTPQSFFDELNAEFGFTLDPCASAQNTKCETFYTKEHDGLKQDWKNHRVFCNPPYGKTMREWARKCYEASLGGALVALLAHARTDTRWFHDWVYRKADEIRFVRGRLKFGDGKQSAPFPSMVAVYLPRQDSEFGVCRVLSNGGHAIMGSFKRAIIEMTTRLLPAGFDVSDNAPQTFEELNDLLNPGSRMRVWSGASTDTIYEDANVNFAFRAWHDLCHWWGAFPFTLAGEIATCGMQCRQLAYFYGENERTRKWCAVLRAEVIGQARYFERHKRFPERQTTFFAAYMADAESALQWPLW